MDEGVLVLCCAGPHLSIVWLVDGGLAHSHNPKLIWGTVALGADGMVVPSIDEGLEMCFNSGKKNIMHTEDVNDVSWVKNAILLQVV